MGKTGKKINKINFNKFIWLYWKMKKKNWWFSSSWNEKKNDVKKKKTLQAG